MIIHLDCRRNYKHSPETLIKMSLSQKGKTVSEHFKNTMRRKQLERIKNDPYYNNKYVYLLNNQQDYFSYFNTKQRAYICGKFTKQNSNIIIYKNITIERKLK